MAGKTIETKSPVSIDALRAKVVEKYTAVPFEHPEGYGIVEIARLKRHEREAIQAATRIPNGAGGWTVDTGLQSRMAASFGLVNPKLTAEELKEFPDDFIEPISEKVFEISNAYRDNLPKDEKAGESAPFFTKSSSVGDSVSPSDGPSPK